MKKPPLMEKSCDAGHVCENDREWPLCYTLLPFRLLNPLVTALWERLSSVCYTICYLNIPRSKHPFSVHSQNEPCNKKKMGTPQITRSSLPPFPTTLCVFQFFPGECRLSLSLSIFLFFVTFATFRFFSALCRAFRCTRFCFRFMCVCYLFGLFSLFVDKRPRVVFAAPLLRPTITLPPFAPLFVLSGADHFLLAGMQASGYLPTKTR